MSSIPPIDFEDLEPALARDMRPKYERLGYLGDFFQFAGEAT